MPLYAWSPKGTNAHVRHYGPMAQDFMAAFGLGDDDKMIGMQDADGVALAAIQGLNAKLESRAAEQSRRIAEQELKIAEQARALSDERRWREALAHEIAEVKSTVEVLLARTATNNRVAQAR